MKRSTALLIGLSCLTSLSFAQKRITVDNPTKITRNELVSIPYSQFSKHFAVDSIFTVKDKETGEIIPHQLEKKGTPFIQNVLVQVQIRQKGKRELIVTKDKAPALVAKTYARYIPERKDDFAWENDVVAFRYYGKALEGTSEDAQGIDFWAKRTTDLIINDWYKSNDYHVDHGQGLDYYSVGQTLGVGDIALYIDDKVNFTKHYRSYQILDNGPLRTTFKLNFEPETIVGNNIKLSKTVTLDAGQQFNKIVVNLNNENQLATPVVIGLAKRGEENPSVYYNTKKQSLAYWEPQIKNFGQTGTAVIVPDSKVSPISTNSKQYLVKTTIKTRRLFTYYNGAAWNKAGKITSAEDWQKYVSDYAENLKKPLKIKLK